MARDIKYGKVTVEHGNIEDDEPVVVFRARDVLLDTVLAVYSALCKKAGSSDQHLNLIEETRNQVNKWQNDNLERVRIPNSNSYTSRMSNQ